MINNRFLQNHHILRYGLSNQSGATIPDYNYDMKINQLKGEFDASDDLIMYPVYFFGCADLYIPIKGSAYAKAEYEWYDRREKRMAGNSPRVALHQTPRQESTTCDILLIGKILSDSPIEFGTNTLPFADYEHFWSIYGQSVECFL